MNDFLLLENKKFLVFGVANKKSVAYHITKNLLDCGAHCVLVVLNDEIRQKVAKIFPKRRRLEKFIAAMSKKTRKSNASSQKSPRATRNILLMAWSILLLSPTIPTE